MNLTGALVWAFRQVFVRHPILVSGFPLRCQHCAKSIRLAGRAPSGAPVYRDAEDFVICETETYLPHRPMPSVLG